MAKKVYDEEINKHTNWGGDESTGNLPVSGNRVQEFIKKTLNGKMGIIHYDTTNNRYIVFADEETRDSYLKDPTQTELILGTFDAPFNYTASINLLTSNYVAILTGTTGNIIRFTFDVVNKQGSSVGENVLCTYTFIKGSTKKVVKARYRYNEEVSFSVDDYISDGTNNIIISITGETTLAATSMAITYQVVNLFISDEYDISRVYNLNANPNAIAEIPFTVKGYGTKTVEWYLDKAQLPEESYVDEVTATEATRTKNISLSNLQEGIHSIQLRAYTVINGEKFYSKTLYREIIIHNGVSQNNYIAVAAELPMGKVITNVEHFYGTQFIDFPLRLAAYSPINAASINVVVSIDGTNITTVAAQNGIVYDLLIPLSNSGELNLVLTDGSVSNSKVIEVSVGDIKLEEINDGLTLYLTAKGKTNSALDKDSWVYKSVSTTFSGFKWNSISGWNNGALYIPNGASISVGYAPLAGNVTAKGKTIEFEIGSTNVYNDNAILMDLRNSNGVGLLITASEITLTSAGGAKISKRYMSNEVIRVSIVINRTSGVNNKCLAFIYVNGENSGAVNFAETDSFTSNSNIVIRGSESATAIIKSIRIYDIALSDEQILNNYAFYSDNVTKLSIINRNNILNSETNEIDYSKVANQLPVMIITGDIPSLEATTDKKKSIKVDVQYINNQDPDLSFTMKNAKMTPQGTSSMRYPKKNYKLYSNDSTDTIVYDSEGKIIADRLYAFKKGSIPVSVWCFKADYAESSGTHNTGIAKLWNDVLKNAKMTDIDSRYYDNTSEYVFRTKAQKAAISNDYPYDVRTTVDGFPICIFYKMTEDSELVFLGKYNFNNDKSTENVFGFKDIPGFDNTNMQCWEVLNNGDPLALFTNVSDFDTITANGIPRWQDAYESRYPDTKKPNTAQLKAFCQWVNSTSNFSNEKWQHLDVYKVAAYYIYLMRHGAVDQAVKNAMLTSEDGQHFFFILYDNDTTHGLRNDSLLVYEPTIDRQSLDPTASTTVYAYAGHDSVLWNSLEADTEFMEIVEKVDAALYNAGLTYDNAIKMFDVEQAGKWCERIYNADAQYKYIGPFNESAINNLYMLQGSRKTHRKWWLSRRFSIYDAIWGTGNYKSQSITFKLLTAPSGLNFTITSGYDTYYGYGINNVIIAKGIKLAVNESHTFTTNRVLNVGDPVGIYSANNLRAIDLSELAAYISTLDIAKVYSETLGTQLKKLVIGKTGTVNTSLASIDGLISAEKLEYLDITGFNGLTNLPLESLENLKTLIAGNCGVTSFAFKDGASLEKLVLPDTTRALSLSHVDTLRVGNFTMPYDNLRILSIKNCEYLNSDITIVNNWIDALSISDGFTESSLTMEGINWINCTLDDNKTTSLHYLIDAINRGLNIVSLKGYIKLTSCNDEQMAMLEETFGANVFNPNSELYISIPDGVFIYGNNSVIEGESLQLTARVISENPGEIIWSIISGGTNYQSIDSNGLLTTTEHGVTRSVTVQVKHIPTSGTVVTATMQIEIAKAIRPTGGTISGQDALSGEGEYTLDVIPNETNKPYSVNWTLSGEGYDNGYVSIKSHSNSNCVLQSTSDAVGNFKLVATITSGETIITIEKTIILGILLTLNISSNQGEDSDIDSLSATVRYNGKNITARNGVAIGIPKNTQCTISFPDVEGYRKPDTIEIVSGDSSITKDVTYETEVVKVTLTSLDNLDIIGQTVTINNQQFTWNGTVITKKVAFGTEYTVSASAKEEYSTPTLTFTANQAVRNVELVYTAADIAVSIKTNPEVMACLNSAGLCANENYMTKEEAAAVTEQQLKPSNGNSIFYQNSKIKTFNEFKYFTSISQIPAECFISCSSLISIEIPHSVTSIGDWAFFGCRGLTAIEIPSSVTSIGGNSIRNCHSLTSIEIPNSVTFIGELAFDDCRGLTSVSIGNSVTTIGNFAFYNCISLTAIEIPSSVTSIGNSIFQGCSSLESITVKSGNTVYDSRDNCNALIKTATNTLLSGCKNTIIPNSVTSIGNDAFYKCSGLTSVVIPNSVTSIGDNAFEGCSGLTSVVIPNSVTSIGSSAFKGCRGLTSVVIPNSVTSIGYFVFQNCSGLISIEIPNSVTSIGSQVFSGCSGLTSVVIPNSVRNIGYSAFSGCISLTSVVIPTSASIGDAAFSDCSGLTSVVLPNSSIGDGAFSGCTNLGTITVHATKAPYVESGTFGNSAMYYTGRNNYDKGTNILYVPSGATGYDASSWLDPLQDSTKCGFTISYTL